MSNIVEVINLNKSYKTKKNAQALHVLKDLNFTVEVGEMVAIVGKSGSGKSTLLNVLGCVDNFESGDYIFSGKSIKGATDKQLSILRNRNISFVFQDYALIEEESVLQNVKTPLFFNKSISLGKMKDLAMEALRLVGIDDLAPKKVNQLSGGQKQRTAIARAIVSKPNLILADEPTGALDSQTSNDILTLLKDLNQKGTTVLVVTHDMDTAAYCNRTVTIVDGKVSEE